MWGSFRVISRTYFHLGRPNNITSRLTIKFQSSDRVLTDTTSTDWHDWSATIGQGIQGEKTGLQGLNGGSVRMGLRSAAISQCMGWVGENRHDRVCNRECREDFSLKCSRTLCSDKGSFVHVLRVLACRFFGFCCNFLTRYRVFLLAWQSEPWEGTSSRYLHICADLLH